jgi:hypothetical protein
MFIYLITVLVLKLPGMPNFKICTGDVKLNALLRVPMKMQYKNQPSLYQMRDAPGKSRVKNYVREEQTLEAP